MILLNALSDNMIISNEQENMNFKIGKSKIDVFYHVPKFSHGR